MPEDMGRSWVPRASTSSEIVQFLVALTIEPTVDGCIPLRSEGIPDVFHAGGYPKQALVAQVRLALVVEFSRGVVKAFLLQQAVQAEEDALSQCQGRRQNMPVGRSKSVPPEVIGQRKCPRQLFRRSVPETGWQQA